MKLTRKVLIFLFPSLIVLAFLGRALFNIGFGLALVLFLLECKSINFRAIWRDYLFRGWVIFVLFVGATVPFAYDVSFSAKKYFVFVVYSFAALIIALWLYVYDKQRKENIEAAMRVLFVSIIIMESITIFNVISGFDLLHFLSHHFEKVPQRGNYHLREVFTVMVFFLILDRLMKKKNIFTFLFLVIPILGILASTSRTAIVTLVVGGVFFIIAHTKRLFSKELVALGIVMMATFGVASALFPEIKQRLETFKTTFSPHGDRMSLRYDVYLDSLQRIKNNVLFGHGVKCGVVYAKNRKGLGGGSKHPHNIYLEILLDSGVIGFVGFLIFLFYFFRRFRPYLSDSAFIGVMSAVFLTSLVSWSIWSANHIALVLLLIVLTAGYIELKHQRTANGEGLAL